MKRELFGMEEEKADSVESRQSSKHTIVEPLDCALKP